MNARKLRVVQGCPQPDPPPYKPIKYIAQTPRIAMTAQYAHYIPQPEDRRVARVVMRHLHDATPGGIRREQFIHRRHPVKTALAILPFVALVALAAFAVITR